MADESALEELRRRIGVVAVVERLALAGEVGEALRPAVEVILKSPGEPHLLGPTSALCGFTPFHFSRVWKHALGVGFHEFTDRVRVDRALVALAESSGKTESIARAHGFLGVTTMGLSIEEYTGLPFPMILALLRP